MSGKDPCGLLNNSSISYRQFSSFARSFNEVKSLSIEFSFEFMICSSRRLLYRCGHRSLHAWVDRVVLSAQILSGPLTADPTTNPIPIGPDWRNGPISR